MKLILSLSHLRHNSGGAKPFSGGANAPFAPPRKIPGRGILTDGVKLNIREEQTQFS